MAQPIETAPLDGTHVTVITKRGRRVRAFWDGGLVDDRGREVFGWFAVNEGEYPPCWTDGICWAENEDGVPSDPPITWEP
jgi:hypothetical protein